ncbi:hypothetical protein [Arthrobacter sp. ERGS1:01]|uniref:hypothetical protein n=1 Tax=Arthrobacter sp. ERGS1:01 TaxID=1704044 RepID=UPI0012373046|nr:hypothetical protein [Arthrobacter sp. ERGS1:01]
MGLLALLTAGISGALNVFNIGSAALTWTALVLFAAVLAGLRSVAVRDQNLRRAAWQASAEARATANARSAGASSAAPAPRETVLFDGAEGAEPAPVQKPLTAEELRNAALRVAAKGTADAILAHTQTLAEGELDGETWEPVEVPKPGYVTAARAASKEAPLEVPEAPKSAGTSIKADQAGVGVGPSVPVVVEGGKADADAASEDAAKDTKDAAESTEKTSVAAKPGKAAHGLTNLDVVLQRRRA